MELYPFSYFDDVRRRWVRARYLATLDELHARYRQFRIEGPPEIREARGGLTAGHLGLGPPVK